MNNNNINDFSFLVHRFLNVSTTYFTFFFTPPLHIQNDVIDKKKINKKKKEVKLIKN